VKGGQCQDSLGLMAGGEVSVGAIAPAKQGSWYSQSESRRLPVTCNVMENITYYDYVLSML
jgi:hypothetical protein